MGKALDFRSVFVDPPQAAWNIPPPPVRITFPDGTHMFSNQHDDVDYNLSKVFGRDVRLMRANGMEEPRYEEYWPDTDGLAQRGKVTDENMPSQTFFDIAVIHIMTTSTINRLRELYPEGHFEVRRFRPNILIESSSVSGEQEKNKKGFIENSWVGKKIMIGEDSIVLKVTSPCTRCVMITLPQGDLPNDLGILRTVAMYNEVTAGVYASVQRSGGTIRRGDLVLIEEG
jgi:MOSC domain-containing protein